MKKKNLYTEAQFYVDGKLFLKEISTIVKNLSRDDKHSFGYDLLKSVRDFISNFSLSFKEKDEKIKYDLAIKSRDCIDLIDIQLTLIKDINVITNKQFVNLYKHLGLLSVQTYGWCSSLENKR